MTIKSNNDLVGNLVKRAMDLTVQIASLTWTASLQGLLFALEAAMERNKGQETCWQQMSEDVKASEWKQRSIREDARKFEQIIKESRVRLGLEVSYV